MGDMPIPPDEWRAIVALNRQYTLVRPVPAVAADFPALVIRHHLSVFDDYASAR